MLYAYCSLWLSDVIQRHRSESTLSLPQVVARCHYVNQSWLFIGIGKVLCHSPESICTLSAQATPLYNDFENCPFKMIAQGANDLIEPHCTLEWPQSGWFVRHITSHLARPFHDLFQMVVFQDTNANLHQRNWLTGKSAMDEFSSSYICKLQYHH